MALNDDLMDDIIETKDDIVVPPNTDITPNKQEVVIEPLTGINKTEETNLTETQLAELPKMDVKFKMVTDNVVKVADLKEVEADILGLESICKQDAVELSEKIPGFLSKKLSLEHYTVQRSKVCFEESIRQLRTSISKEQMETVQLFTMYLNDTIAATKTLLDVLTQEYVDSTISKTESIGFGCRTLKDSLPTNKNVVYPIDNEFINISTTALDKIDFTKISVTEDSGKSINMAVKILFELMEYKTVKTLLLGLADSKSFEYSISQDAILEYGNKSLTVMDIINIYSSNTIGDVILSISKDIFKLKVTLESIYNDWNKLTDNDNRYDVILSITSDVNKFNKDISRSVNLINSIRLINVNADVILEFFKTV